MVLDGAVAVRCKDISNSPVSADPRKVLYIGHMSDYDYEVVTNFLWRRGIPIREPGDPYEEKYYIHPDLLETWPRWFAHLRQITYINARLNSLSATNFWSKTVSVSFIGIQITPYIGGEFYDAFVKEATFEAIEHAYIAEFTLHARDWSPYKLERPYLYLDSKLDNMFSPLTASEGAVVLEQFSRIKPTWINYLFEW